MQAVAYTMRHTPCVRGVLYCTPRTHLLLYNSIWLHYLMMSLSVSVLDITRLRFCVFESRKILCLYKPHTPKAACIHAWSGGGAGHTQRHALSHSPRMHLESMQINSTTKQIFSFFPIFCKELHKLDHYRQLKLNSTLRPKWRSHSGVESHVQLRTPPPDPINRSAQYACGQSIELDPSWRLY